MEFVDIIDEVENVIQTVSKDKAHQEGLLHKCVISEVIDSRGRWLMVKQARDRQDAGQYVSPVGGHVSAGETESMALLREAEEEVGLRGGLAYEAVGRAIFDRSVLGRRENHLFVAFKIFSDAPPKINEESESFRYFTEKELRRGLRERPEQFGGAFHFVVKNFFPYLLQAPSQKDQKV